jgi:CRISPR-associated protein Cmr5
MSRTLGQQRAEFCLEQLEHLQCQREEFKNFSAGLPAMILQNGFGQALAFLAAKSSGRDKHSSAFSIIASWLHRQNLIQSVETVEVLKEVSSMPQDKYLHAQKETLAMLEWLKRYANAELF